MLTDENGHEFEMVEVAAKSNRIARRYMIHLDTKDCEQSERLTSCATVLGLTGDAFRERFASVVAHERGR